jgi:hypothetical protein
MSKFRTIRGRIAVLAALGLLAAGVSAFTPSSSTRAGACLSCVGADSYVVANQNAAAYA